MLDELARVLAAHDDVDGIWYFGSAETGSRSGAALGRQHEANLGGSRAGGATGRSATRAGEEFLEHATQIKNIWVPYGE